MANPDPSHEVLSLPPREYPSDNEYIGSPVQPVLDNLFSEFTRRHRSLSPSTRSSSQGLRGSLRQRHQTLSQSMMLDLRVLDYAGNYDEHLMCPICHVPFIDPVVLECDHTFCASCLGEYKRGLNNSDGSQCPSCRTFVHSRPRKASRLIYNMCNDIKVKCPNEGCTATMARGYIQRHTTKVCPEQKLPCADVKCTMETKRKNYIPGQCIHDTKIECDCGAMIELGRGEWLKHKDESCPNTTIHCQKCDERITVGTTSHVCKSDVDDRTCPGVEFGCTNEIEGEIEDHILKCPLAKLAPYLKSQSRLLQSMQQQLASWKLRNEALEAELERLNHTLTNTIQPKLDHLTLATHSSEIHHDDFDDHETEVEEIHRDEIPSAAAIHHRDLLLPAHIRDLTPSPDLVSAPTSQHPRGFHAGNQTHMYNHLLGLHESLQRTVSSMETEINSLHHAIADVDARTNMQVINETLRIKEDLAYTNAMLISHRSQVQYLLNRERIGREQAILRGRAMQSRQSQGNIASDGEGPDSNILSPGSSMNPQQGAQSESFPFPGSSVGMTRTASGSGGGSGPSSAATSPLFSAMNLVGSAGSTRRPSMRGGSQERVKL